MITDELIKQEFISRIVSRDIKQIYQTQESVVREVFTGGTGRLAGHLSRMPFSESGSGLEKTYYVRIFPYLRFLDIRYRRQDMKTRRKLALYNRVVYGVLYNETMPDLRYGMTAAIRKEITESLQNANPAVL